MAGEISTGEIYGRCHFLKEWLFWDVSIHASQAQIERQGRAMTYPFSFKINRSAQAGTFSSTSDLPFYSTTLSECNCYDFQNRHLPCKHMYRLAVELGIIEIIKRPSFDKAALRAIKESNSIDDQPDQKKRIEKAKEEKCRPSSIDYDAGIAIFEGSGKKPYETTVNSCTCRDFFVRRLPCKHIYRLRMELENREAR